MSGFKTMRYCYEPKDVDRFYWKWCRIGKEGWESFDSFLLFAAEHNIPGKTDIKKIFEWLPWSPENIAWTVDGETVVPEGVDYDEKEQWRGVCAGCRQEVCTDSLHGCAVWRWKYIENWNRNIHRSTGPKGRDFFRYEHPDIVRERMRKRGKK